MACHDLVPCGFNRIGRCTIAQDIDYQATDGSRRGWKRANWEAYIARIERDVLPHCLNPEELRKALDTVSPEFID